MTEDTSPVLIYLVAGEASGDLLGASVMSALLEECDGNVRFIGVGGPEMISLGLHSLFPMEELSIMGVAEVIPRLPQLVKRINQTVSDIILQKPSAVVTIDSPDFCFRVAGKVKRKAPEIALIHYVAPSVWAWRPGRARKISNFLDHLLTLLPFEPPLFEKEGLPATFVGHPAVEGGADQGDGKTFRNQHQIDPSTPLVAVLPGSRRGEIKRLMPVFGETIDRMKALHPGIEVVIPTIDSRLEQVQEQAELWQTPVTVITGKKNKFDAFAAADVALAASGTVALELALASTPAIIAYRVNRVTSWLARRLIKVRYVSLVNIILNKEAVPEFIQENCTPEHLTPALEALLIDAQCRTVMQHDYLDAVEQLKVAVVSPGKMAATAILNSINS